MPIVVLLYHQDNLRPLVLRCANVYAIDLLLSACYKVFPRYEALKIKYEPNIMKLKNFFKENHFSEH